MTSLTTKYRTLFTSLPDRNYKTAHRNRGSSLKIPDSPVFSLVKILIKNLNKVLKLKQETQ